MQEAANFKYENAGQNFRQVESHDQRTLAPVCTNNQIQDVKLENDDENGLFKRELFAVSLRKVKKAKNLASRRYALL